jgi:hypothetical protein
MRTGLKVGLLAAIIACAAFVAAKAQEEKSYLPPKSFQGKGESTVSKTWAPKTVQTKPVRYASAHTRHARVYHHGRTRVAHHSGYHRHRYAHRGDRRYYRQRYAYYRPVFPGFLFGLFNW